MNKQIIKLAEQAKGFVDLNQHVGGDNGCMVYTYDGLEKFAELIVAECSRVIVNGGYRNPAFGEKHPLTPPEIAKMIKEHFGVEEVCQE
jgi:hypothetical protein